MLFEKKTELFKMPKLKRPFPKRRMLVEEPIGHALLLEARHMDFLMRFQDGQRTWSSPSSYVPLTWTLGDRSCGTSTSSLPAAPSSISFEFSVLLSVLGQKSFSVWSFTVFLTLWLSSISFQYSLFYCLFYFYGLEQKLFSHWSLMVSLTS